MIDTSHVLMDIEKIKSIIPHRFPLLLIEKIHSLEFDNKIIASFELKADNPIFSGHFPEYPIYPGVYYIESIAQAGAVLMFESRKKRGIFDDGIGFLSAVEKARFRKICKPGDTLIYEVSIEKSRGPFFWFQGKVFVGEDTVAEVSISVALGEKPS